MPQPCPYSQPWLRSIRTTEDANGGSGGVVILAAAAQRQQRRATDISGGVDENDEGCLIWGRRWRQRCCNVDLLTPGQAREGVYLGDFKKNKNSLGARSHACSRQVIWVFNPKGQNLQRVIANL
jgi:hypothetical protein